MIIARHLSLMSAELQTAWASFSWSSPRTRMALKTALAAVSAILVTYALSFSDGFWAGISAVIMMKPNVGATFQKAWMRAGGACVGSALSMVVTSLFVQEPLGFSVSIFLIMTAGFYLGATRTSGYFWSYMFGHMALISMISVMDPACTIDVVVTRAVAVSIGVIVSCIVHTVLWPEYAHETLHQETRALEGDLFRFVRHIMDEYVSGSFDAKNMEAEYHSLRKRIAEQRQFVELTRYERVLFRGHLMRQEGQVETLAKHLHDFMEFYRSLLAEADIRYITHFAEPVSALMGRLSEWMASRNRTNGAHRRLERKIENLFKEIQQPKPPSMETEEERPPILAIMVFYEGMHFLKRFFRDLSTFSIADRREEYRTSFFHGASPGKDDRFLARHIRTHLPVLQYAIKGGLGILIVFWFWLWAEIPGGGLNMSVAVITVLQVDLMTTYQRGMLRFLGCFLGAAFGLLLLGLQVDNTLVMALIAFWAVFPLAYIWASGPNAAYLGAQAALALIIALFPDRGPATTLAPVIERLVGIFLAVLTIWGLNLLLWPQDLTEHLDDLLSAARKRLLRLGDLMDRFYRRQPFERPSGIDAADRRLIGAVIDTLEEQREISPEEAFLTRQWVTSLNELFDESSDLMATGGPHLALLRPLGPDVGREFSEVISALAMEPSVTEAEKTVAEIDNLMETVRDMAEQLRDLTHEKDTRFKVACSLHILAIRRILIRLKELCDLQKKRMACRRSPTESEGQPLEPEPVPTRKPAADSA